MNDVTIIIANKNKQIEELQKQLEEQIEITHNLRDEFEQYKLESIKWSVQDFIELEDDYDITEEQAQAALEEMIRKHDCNVGIDWYTVGYYKQQYGTLKETHESID